MENHLKLQIYKGIIQYILESTNYSIKNIAELTDSSVETIQSIYLDGQVSSHFFSEHQLVRLFQIIIGLKSRPFLVKNSKCEY